MKTCLAYSLSYVDALESYLPSAYIVEEKNGKLGYMQRVASLDTIDSFAITWRDTDHEQCLKIIEGLLPKNLEQHYNRGKKKVVTLSKLFHDLAGKKLVVGRIEREVNELLLLIKNNNFPLCYDIERKVFLEDIRIVIQVEPLYSFLKFVKTQTGLNYSLNLSHNAKKIIPFRHDTHIITNDPAWVLIDYQLYNLVGVNGLKLKPFLTKEHVFVPDRIQKDYFDKFIKDVIGTIDSEVDGFEVIEKQITPQCKLTFVEDLASSKLMLSPVFRYGEVEFKAIEYSKQRVNIDFTSGSPIVSIFKRDLSHETQLINQIESLGLKYDNQRLNDGDDDSFSIVNWVSKHKDSLDAAQYTINKFVYKGDIINTNPYKIEFSFSKGIDWFDLHGLITVGEEEIIFADLLNNIAKGNRFFVLKDGTSFIIPDLWMAKYGNMAKFAKIEKGKAKLTSSKYMLLEEMDGMVTQSVHDYRVEAVDIDYKVSPFLKGDLRPYQYDGVKWLVTHFENGFGALLADDMGLGKTIQTLAVLLYAKEQLKDQPIQSQNRQLNLFESNYQAEINPLRALIILPASLVFNWKEEINKFAPNLNVTVYKGVKRDQVDVGYFDVVLTTYQTAAKDFEKLKRIEFSYIILDESHYIKNRTTKLFKNINQLNAKHKISLSGTPIENSLSDLYTQMEFINPDILGSYSFFKKHYQIPIEKHKNEEALQELNQILAPFIKRRTRAEVLGDLPELTEHVIYTEMLTDQKKLFDQEKASARNFLLGIDEASGQYKIHVFAILLRLRKISNHPYLFDNENKSGSGKFEDVTAYLDTICRSDNKVLVFSSFLDHIKIYETYCNDNDIGYETLTGKTPTDYREKAINRFKNDAKNQVFFISLKAGGVGLNLTEANYVIILDPWWNPFAEKQAIARAHRMGQENKVTVTRFISKDSIEEKILKLQQAKLKIASDIFVLEETDAIDVKDISFLLR